MNLNSKNKLHITIGTYPSSSAKLDADLGLIKAALLYGDRVTLCSFTYSILLSAMTLVGSEFKQRLQLLEKIAPNFFPDKQVAEELLGVIKLYKSYNTPRY
jgi:hypothetical protein